MARAYLRAKAEVLLEGEPYILERKCTDGTWILQQARTGRLIERTVDELFDAYHDDKLAFVTELRGITKRQKKQNADAIRTLTPAERSKAKVRLLYARAALDVPQSRSRIEAVIDEVWDSFNPKPETKPGWVSVYRWVRALRDSGEAPVALVTDHASKGNRESRYPDEVIQICEDFIESTYLTRERPTEEHTLNLAQAKVREANKLRPKASQLTKPTRRLLRRLIEKIPAFDRYVARYGRDAARKKFRSVLAYRLTEAPLECGEIDHTRMDFFVVDEETGMPLGRPWLTVLIDNDTRCILGYHLSFEPPSRATVAACLRHAFMPKSNLRTEYPDLKNDWVPFGVVASIIMDNGLEFHSADIENVCFELGIEQHYAPRKTAWFKGKVERFQGTLSRGVAVTLPGKTFSSILERDDYDPQKHAVVTLSALRHLIVRWIVDVYHQRKHCALDCSPHVLWTSRIRTEDIPLMDNPLRFDAILGGVENRVLTHKGIEFAGLVYNSPEMTELRRQLGDKLDVEIRVDRSNLGSIIVLHPERKTPYRVRCLRPDYAEGLTEWQHKVCKRYAREKYNAENDVDAWLDALLEISEIVSKELKLGKRKGASRERMARWREGKQDASRAPESEVQAMPAEAATAAVSDAEPATALPPPQAPIQTTQPVTAQPVGMQPTERKRFVPIFEQRPPSLINSFETEKPQ